MPIIIFSLYKWLPDFLLNEDNSAKSQLSLYYRFYFIIGYSKSQKLNFLYFYYKNLIRIIIFMMTEKLGSSESLCSYFLLFICIENNSSSRSFLLLSSSNNCSHVGHPSNWNGGSLFAALCPWFSISNNITQIVEKQKSMKNSKILNYDRNWLEDAIS